MYQKHYKIRLSIRPHVNIIFLVYHCYILFSMFGRESIVLGSIFRNGDFDEFTHLRSPESESHIFRGWPECVCACLSINSMNPEQILAQTLNLVLYIFLLCRCYLKAY